MNELSARPQADLTSDIGETTEVSWTAPANMTFDQFQQIGNTFRQIKESLAWWLGDWLVAGEDRFGEASYQAIPDSGKSLETLMKYKAVAFRVPAHIRNPRLLWTHHFYVCYLPEEERGELLEMAANVGLSSRELKEVAKLDDETRYQFILAYRNYTKEVGPMDKDTFFAVLNRFKLGDSPEPREEADDDEYEDEQPHDRDNGGQIELDDVTDFWENAGVPLSSIGPNQAVWQGMIVYAAMNARGKAILVWEQVNGEH